MLYHVLVCHTRYHHPSFLAVITPVCVATLQRVGGPLLVLLRLIPSRRGVIRVNSKTPLRRSSRCAPAIVGPTYIIVSTTVLEAHFVEHEGALALSMLRR